MNEKTTKIAITGAGGQVAYSLLPRLSDGEVFGKDTLLDLRLLETPTSLNALKSVLMELEDCAFPLLEKITITDDARLAFKDVDWALLIGARPRGPGMERSDLIKANAAIFVEQGKALNDVAKKKTKVLVVGNPANTNCLIAMHYAKNIPKERFAALTRLDQNRAYGKIANYSNVNVDKIKNIIIWGNHSATQVPDLEQALVNNQPALEVIDNLEWVQNDFIKFIQDRGAQVIAARGLSSAASASNAIIDHIKSVENKTPSNEFFSAGVYSDGSYGIEEGLIFSFPVQSDGQRNLTVVKNLNLSDFIKNKLKITMEELKKERAMVEDLL